MRAAQENREPGICNYVVIPAFEPDFRLLSLVKGLSGYPGIGIIVVNDGSEKGLCTLFGRTAEYATVLFHRTNRGKGRAVKTALDYIRTVSYTHLDVYKRQGYASAQSIVFFVILLIISIIQFKAEKKGVFYQ